jgi:NADH-ubiquinone oxidoreductase chain 4
MFLLLLIIIPLIGIFIISSLNKNTVNLKIIALMTSLLNAIVSFVILIFFNSSSNNFQFVQEHYNIQSFDIYLGIDGISIYFVILTTIIMPIGILSN